MIYYKLLKATLLSSIIITATMIHCFAVTPKLINYQGFLKEGEAKVTGTRTMIFKLFDSSSTGSELWSSGSQSISVSSGIFHYILGSDVSLNGIDWENKNVYLEVSVEGNPLSPREQLISAPYALNADMVDGLHANQFGGLTRQVVEGSFDTSLSGDIIISTPISNGTNTATIHWKQINLPQISLSDMPMISLYIKGIPSEVTSLGNYVFPENNTWYPAEQSDFTAVNSPGIPAFVIAEGKIFIFYKFIEANWPENPRIKMTGDYKIVIIK